MGQVFLKIINFANIFHYTLVHTEFILFLNYFDKKILLFTIKHCNEWNLKKLSIAPKYTHLTPINWYLLICINL